MLLSPIHCCDVTKPPYLLSGELFGTTFLLTSLLRHLYLHFSSYVLHPCTLIACMCIPSAVGAAVSASLCSEQRHTDAVGDSSGRSYVTEHGHNVPLLRTRGLHTIHRSRSNSISGVLLQISLALSFVFPYF